jgi:hypothetical protein
MAYDRRVDAAQDARLFLLRANRLVDEIAAGAGPKQPARPLSKEPDYRVDPVRFGRTRLFLSRFVGRFAWRFGLGL